MVGQLLHPGLLLLQQLLQLQLLCGALLLHWLPTPVALVDSPTASPACDLAGYTCDSDRVEAITQDMLCADATHPRQQ